MAVGRSILAFLLIGAVVAVIITAASAKDPIVIVPGLMGSQLEARLHKARSTHFYCRHTYDSWYRLWLSLDDILPVFINCFKENIKLHYNSTTDTYADTKGVDIRVLDFGNTTGIETLDPNLKSANYFNVFIDFLVMKGYTRGIDLLAAPFDWRLGPAQLEERGYFKQLRQLIETAYTNHHNTKVTIIAHSLGALVTHHYLTKYVNQKWKNTYINQYITLGGPWAGCSKALHTIISGSTDSIFKLSIAKYIRPVERSFPSGYWLLPMPYDHVWNTSVHLVTTPNRKYSALDISSLIRDLGIPYGHSMYVGVTRATPIPLTPPNVATHCIYGNSLQTEESYNYENFPDGHCNMSYGLGDGTVNLRSLRVCNEWVGKQAWPVKAYEMGGVEHFGMLNDEKVLDIVWQLISVK